MADLTAYVPRLLLQWEERYGDAKHQAIEGTLVFADVSGFTKLSEALAKKGGKAGAEELADVINYLFGELLMLAAVRGGEMLKYGGDAMLLFFSGPDHALRGAAACADMQRRLREIGRIDTGGAGVVRLRMSVGAHAGNFDFFVAGGCHRELIVAGPDTTVTVEMEAAADATEVLMSPAMAAMLPARHAGASKSGGLLLRGNPKAPLIDTVPLETDADPSRFLAAPLVRHLASEGAEPEHRLATVAFLQFLELDRLLYSGRAEDAAAKVDEVLTLIEQVFLEFDVTFLATDLAADGGKVMAAAGAPTTRGDDEERMLRACRKILDSSPALPVRIGVHRGHVFAGDVGPRFRRTYTTLGDVTNTAARVMGKATGGHCFALEPVLAASRAQVEAVEQPPFMAKGKSEPLVPFDVGAIGSEKATAGVLPLIGRDQELRALLDAVDGAVAGHGRSVALVGEAGLGKSRLILEAHASRPDVPFVTTTCHDYAATTAYAPLRPLLESVVGFGSADALRTTVERVAPHLLPWLPLLAIPLDVDVPSTPQVDQLDPSFVRDRLHAVIVDLLGRLVDGPAVWVVDDCHLMDSASRDLLQALVTACGQWPMAIVVTTDEAEDGQLPVQPDERIDLDPLSAEDAAAAAAAAAGSRLLPQQIAHLVERSGGNPLFLSALAAMDGGFAADEVPSTIEALLATRIDALPPRERWLVRKLSVLGASFDARTAEAVAGEPVADGPFAAAVGEFIHRDGEHLRFRHSLVREAAYEGLPFRVRRMLHRQAGEFLEAHTSAPETVAELLSLHFDRSRDYDRAATYSEVAAARAETKFAFLEAAEFHRRAAEAMALAGHPPHDVAKAWQATSEALRRGGAFGEAAEALRRARRCRIDRELLAWMCYQEGTLQAGLGRHERARRWHRRGIRILEESGVSSLALESRLHEGLASVTYEQGKLRQSRRWAELAVEAARASGDLDALARAYLVLHCVVRDMNDEEQDTVGVEALQAATQLGDLRLQALVLANLGVAAHLQGRRTEGEALYRQAKDANDASGNVIGGAVNANNLGEIYLDDGHYEEARRMFEDAVAVFRAAGSWYSLIAQRNLAQVAAHQGRFDEAYALLDDTAASFHRLGARQQVAETETTRAEVLALEGRHAEAEPLARSLLAGAAGDGAVALERVLEEAASATASSEP